MKKSARIRLGIIGGAGWLGGAIATGVLDGGLIESQNLSLSYRRQRPNRFPEAFWTLDNQALVDRSGVIILSVRPSDWHQIEVNADGKLVISVMAGIPLSAICEQLRTSRVVRALPNAAAEVRKSYTAWTATAGTTDDDRTVVRDIFSTCGVQDEVQTEAQIDYLTGLTGSGPAFPALLAKAMMDDAVLHGLDRDMARRAVNTLIIGAGRLLERHDECPGDTVQAFLDYRGTTAAAIDEMRKAGFDSAVARGLTAALEKSVSMGAAS